MIITKIEKQKNNPKRYSIFVDDKFAFGISEIDLLYYKLKENETIDEEEYTYILDNIVLKQAKDKALKYLSYKIRSKAQVVKKLEDEMFPEHIINKVLNILEKYNYINDENFAKIYIKNAVDMKGYGQFRISYNLENMGVSKDIFEKYLYDTNFIDEKKKAVQLLEKKTKNINISTITYKNKQKFYTYLAQRGFSYDCIKYAFNVFFNDKTMEDNDIYE